MSFTDSHTLSDLNILGTAYEENSIFDFLNHTQTHGGKIKLSALLKSPLNELSVIRKRQEAILFLKEADVSFEFNKEEYAFIEHYLNQNSLLLKSNIIDSTWNWLRSKYKPSNDYYVISRGLHYLRRNLSRIIKLSDQLRSSGQPEYYDSLNTFVNHIRAEQTLSELLSRDHSRIRFWNLGRFDFAIRVKQKETIKTFLHLSYELDVFLSVANTLKKTGMTFPEFKDSPEPYLFVEGLYHPLLYEPVKNDFQIGTPNICMLTGANMTGKSTFLKSAGICVYLAHLGFPVPADKMVLSLFDTMHSTVNIADNLQKGYSHFFSEVKRVKEILRKLQKDEKVFVIFDELFRSTNVKDAKDATILIARGFSKIRNAVFMISTHINEAAEALKNDEGVDFKCFHYQLIKDKPVYDYKLADGITDERLGLTILKNEGITEIISDILDGRSDHMSK
jgi:DNA mismatch repair ATPase MutS